MRGAILVVTTFVLTAVGGVEAQPCGLRTVNMTVNSGDDANNLSDALTCTGGGTFEVSWNGSIQISRSMVVANGSVLSVTGLSPPAWRVSFVLCVVVTLSSFYVLVEPEEDGKWSSIDNSNLCEESPSARCIVKTPYTDLATITAASVAGYIGTCTAFVASFLYGQVVTRKSVHGELRRIPLNRRFSWEIPFFTHKLCKCSGTPWPRMHTEAGGW